MVEMKRKDEIISISLGDIKYFYKAALLATEKQDSGIVLTEGKIPDATITEYYATLASVKTYKNGKVDGDVKISDVQTNTVVLHETYKEGSLEATKETPKPSEEKILSKPLTFTRSLFERVFYSDGKETTRQVLDKTGAVVSSSGEALTGSAKDFYPNVSLKI
jgi:antitoxin component YwqK of YwqJK toxin-antitoxin module